MQWWAWLALQPLVAVVGAGVAALAEIAIYRARPDAFPNGLRWGFIYWLRIAIIVVAAYSFMHFAWRLV